MKRDDEREAMPSIVSDLACWGTATIFVVGLLVLAVRLKEVQIDDSAEYNYANARQSIRRVQTAGIRGRILDRHGKILADNRLSVSIVCQATRFQQRSWRATVTAITNEIARVGAAIGVRSAVNANMVKRHVNQRLAMPLVVWRDVDHVTLARFLEHEGDFPGFICGDDEERFYPHGQVAAHVLGYVGRDRIDGVAGDEKFNFFTPEMRGRSGLESYYDGFLRGVSGEKKLRVDARGFAVDEWEVVAPQRGPDLQLTLDVELQRVAERQLAGLCGACVAIDPRNGEVLVMASAPTYNPNEFVPVLRQELYRRYADDPAKPLLNRASGGAYAPGSTFKPITTLAGLSAGISEGMSYCCCGVYFLGDMHLRCARRWGHGDLDMRHALMESCNPFFCNLGVTSGTNALMRTAKAMGLGAKTGLDLAVDMAGVVPNAEWKQKMYNEKWFYGDLAQMSIGQGMLLVSPLQMARVAGAIGTGYLVTPHFKADLPVERTPLPFSSKALRVVRDGMRMVVAGDGERNGTGRRGGEGVPVAVCGKTGTAEVGRADNRRKNTWFIAYAPADNPVIAVALVVENGQSGGGTAAPKVAEILKSYFTRQSFE